MIAAIKSHLARHENEGAALHSVALLNSLDRELLRAQRDDVSEIATRAERVGPRAAEQARLLRGRLN